jgi:spore coat protein CotF
MSDYLVLPTKQVEALRESLEKVNNLLIAIDQVLAGEAPVAKKRGRKAKAVAAPAAATPAKRGPGRPRKVAAEAPATEL